MLTFKDFYLNKNEANTYIKGDQGHSGFSNQGHSGFGNVFVFYLSQQCFMDIQWVDFFEALLC